MFKALITIAAGVTTLVTGIVTYKVIQNRKEREDILKRTGEDLAHVVKSMSRHRKTLTKKQKEFVDEMMMDVDCASKNVNTASKL